MQWAIGIDPGLRETGVVLCRDDTQPTMVEWVTYSCPPGDADITRVVSLAGFVVDCVVGWAREYGIEELDVTIELPVYKHNAATFTKQIRLVEEIESGLFHVATGEVEQFYMTEVYPSTSKGLLTNNGRADKSEMIDCYERVTGQEWPVGTKRHTKETVADAYAHSLASWLTGGNLRLSRLDFTSLKAAIVKEEGRYRGEHR
jgi:Holliday junction resolvasome RuvABC endonuclease subunit